jgi:hypothetical protein
VWKFEERKRCKEQERESESLFEILEKIRESPELKKNSQKNRLKFPPISTTQTQH